MKLYIFSKTGDHWPVTGCVEYTAAGGWKARGTTGPAVLAQIKANTTGAEEGVLAELDPTTALRQAGDAFRDPQLFAQLEEDIQSKDRVAVDEFEAANPEE